MVTFLIICFCIVNIANTTFSNADFAFGKYNQDELKNINSGVSLDELPVNNDGNTNNSNNNNNNKNIFSNSCDKTIDENILNLTNCKYYTVSEFHNSTGNNNLNIFHNNVNGLESKFENFHHFLSNDSTKFDIIAITETSQKITSEKFHTNINLEGYTNFSTASNSNNGGTIIYTKNICHRKD